MTSPYNLGLKESIRVLLSGESLPPRPADNLGSSSSSSSLPNHQCKLCFRLLIESDIGGSVPGQNLDEDTVGIVLQSLLVTKSDPFVTSHQENPTLQQRPLLCSQCFTSLTTLGNLFKTLEYLRGQFNDLRRTIGKLVILGSLGKTHHEWESWKNEVSNVEHIYPSCVTGNGHIVILSNETMTIMETEDAEIVTEEFGVGNQSGQGQMDDDGNNSSFNQVADSTGVFGSSGEGSEQQESDFHEMELPLIVTLEEGDDGAFETYLEELNIVQQNQNQFAPHFLVQEQVQDSNSFQVENNFQSSNYAGGAAPLSSNKQDWIQNSLRKVSKVIHRSKPQFSCPHCSRPYLNRNVLKTHLELVGRQHTIEFPESTAKLGYFPCTQCNDIYMSDVALVQHMKGRHNITTDFNLSDGQDSRNLFSKLQSGRKNEEKTAVEQEKKFLCENCGKKFFTRDGLVTHEQIKHKFKCEECIMEFKEEEEFRNHVAYCRNRWTCENSWCGEEFRTSRSYRYHKSQCKRNSQQ